MIVRSDSGSRIEIRSGRSGQPNAGRETQVLTCPRCGQRLIANYDEYWCVNHGEVGVAAA